MCCAYLNYLVTAYDARKYIVSAHFGQAYPGFPQGLENLEK